MSYLLDTNVISEQRKVPSGRADPNVAAWLATIAEDSCFISVITVQELETWALLRGRRDVNQGASLRRWLDRQVLDSFARRILPVDLAVAKRCAALHVPDPQPTADAFIAATALLHDLTVVTRDIADFAPMGVKVFNPWKPLD